MKSDQKINQKKRSNRFVNSFWNFLIKIGSVFTSKKIFFKKKEPKKHHVIDEGIDII
jgi:hypothetical protein